MTYIRMPGNRASLSMDEEDYLASMENLTEKINVEDTVIVWNISFGKQIRRSLMFTE